MNRRKFVSSLAAATAGTAVSTATSIAPAVHVAGDETIRVALIGCGARGTGAASQALRTKGPVKLWAMADLFEDRLQKSLANLTKGEQAAYDREAYKGLADRIDVPPERRFIGFDAYRRAIDSGVDVVILATTQHFRPEHFEYAVKQGKHVFMEKPLAVDAPGIRRVLAANE
ncbi:MAG TPA: gfo/Idh/MocA family oxidoreductase, partial [Planctomycetaceae bacterium]|nr:gfo/Idh/MocA family oxidoreductase [Planctomycetaceae bacterium]